jgi:UDP-N-acetylmuramate dehydrogenase
LNIQSNIQLQDFNSFKTKAVAKLFATTTNKNELISILNTYPNEKKLILGGGYNIFFTKDYDGLVIKPKMLDLEIIIDNDDYVEIEAGAGIDWDTLVEDCVGRGLSGLENLSLIPGTVGAAPVQNIGAYGTEVKDVITKVTAIDMADSSIVQLSNEQCDFGYRNSIFKQTRRYIITSVNFKLRKTFTFNDRYADVSRELQNNPSPSLFEVRQAIIRIRERKLPSPYVLPNAGSFFKNPILTEKGKELLTEKDPDAPIYNIGNNKFKTSAAYLIDKSGYKGKKNQDGTLGTYQNHALIIVNYGTNDGNDIRDFANEIQEKVWDNYSIKLEPEVWIF